MKREREKMGVKCVEGKRPVGKGGKREVEVRRKGIIVGEEAGEKKQ